MVKRGLFGVLVTFATVVAQAQEIVESVPVQVKPATTTTTNATGNQDVTDAFSPQGEDKRPSSRPKYSPWGVSYFNWATQNMENTNEGVGRLESYNYLSFNYYFKGGTFSIRPVFFINGAGRDFYGSFAKPNVDMGDMYVQYALYDFALLGDATSVTAQFRLSVPTSERSKNNTLYTQFSPRFIFETALPHGNKILYWFLPEISFFQRRGTLNDFGTRVKGNKPLELLHYVEFVERLNSTIGFAQSIGMKHTYSYDVPSANINEIRNNYVNVGVSMIVDLGSVSIKAGVMNEPWVENPYEKFEMFHARDMKYSVMTYARF